MFETLHFLMSFILELTTRRKIETSKKISYFTYNDVIYYISIFNQLQVQQFYYHYKLICQFFYQLLTCVTYTCGLHPHNYMNCSLITNIAYVTGKFMRQSWLNSYDNISKSSNNQSNLNTTQALFVEYDFQPKNTINYHITFFTFFNMSFYKKD